MTSSKKGRIISNFFLEGKRVSSIKPCTDERGNAGYTFRMSILQNYQTNQFAELIVSVNVPKDIWDKFMETTSDQQAEWLEIAGLLTSNYETIDDKKLLVYHMEANHVCCFDSSLYEALGGKCYYSGEANVVTFKNYKPQRKGMNVARLYLTTTSPNVRKFEVLALRKKADCAVKVVSGGSSTIRIVANLMPPTNENGKNKPAYFSLREVSCC